MSRHVNDVNASSVMLGILGSSQLLWDICCCCGHISFILFPGHYFPMLFCFRRTSFFYQKRPLSPLFLPLLLNMPEKSKVIRNTSSRSIGGGEAKELLPHFHFHQGKEGWNTSSVSSSFTVTRDLSPIHFEFIGSYLLPISFDR